MSDGRPSGIEVDFLSRLLWSMGLGLVAGLAALVVSLVILSASPSDWDMLLFSAVAAAALIGAILWYFIMGRAGRRPVLRGALVGLLVVLISHPASWYLAILYAFFSGQTGSLGEPTANPLEGIAIALGYGLLSLVFVGWITLPLGGILGALWAYLQYRFFIKKRP